MMFKAICMYAKEVEKLYNEKQISKREYDACQKRITSALYLRAYDHTQGKDGKIAELLLTPVHGNYNKDSVSPAGKVDCLASDKHRSRKVEIKINGGCVQGLLDAYNNGDRNTLVIYTIAHGGNSLAPATYTTPRIASIEEFINFYNENGKKSSTKGAGKPRDDKKAMIQWIVKKWRLNIDNLGIEYNPFKRYTIVNGQAQAVE